MKIYIAREGKHFGVYEFDHIAQLYIAGNIRTSDLAWHEGLEDWLPISKVIQLESGISPVVLNNASPCSPILSFDSNDLSLKSNLVNLKLKEVEGIKKPLKQAYLLFVLVCLVALIKGFHHGVSFLSFLPILIASKLTLSWIKNTKYTSIYGLYLITLISLLLIFSQNIADYFANLMQSPINLK